MKYTGGNHFDRILKENLVLEVFDVFKRMLDIRNCELDKETKLPEGKIHRTTEREPDFVRVMKQPGGEKFILHLEFQTTDDPEMVYRTQEYHALLQRKTRLPIRHFVLYLGLTPPRMENKLEPGLVYTGFELIDINTYDAERLLGSENPEEVIMAILGNFKGENPVEMIRKILNRLRGLLKDQRKLEKYLYQLTILSRLRNLQVETIQEAETMALSEILDIDNDVLYKRGIEKGIEKDRLEMAIKMKKEGIELSLIAKITGLSKQKILKL